MLPERYSWWFLSSRFKCSVCICICILNGSNVLAFAFCIKVTCVGVSCYVFRCNIIFYYIIHIYMGLQLIIHEVCRVGMTPALTSLLRASTPAMLNSCAGAEGMQLFTYGVLKSHISHMPIHEVFLLLGLTSTSIFSTCCSHIVTFLVLGNTPLHIAIINDQTKCVQLLLEWGVDINIR